MWPIRVIPPLAWSSASSRKALRGLRQDRRFGRRVRSIDDADGTWPLHRRSGNDRRPDSGNVEAGVLTSADQFRPEPPPAPDSPERAAEIAELKDYPRTRTRSLSSGSGRRTRRGDQRRIRRRSPAARRSSTMRRSSTTCGDQSWRRSCSSTGGTPTHRVQRGPTRWSALPATTAPSPAGTASSSTGRRAPINSTPRSAPSCQPTRTRITPRGIPPAWRQRPRC